MPKPITADLACENVKFLHILIFKCEADWAYAMQMKQVAANLTSKQATGVNSLPGNRNNPNRLRMHYLKRFRAAAKTARWVIDNCKGAFDDESQFELEAYSDVMQAVYLMEYHKHDQAIDHLLKAQVIYKQLAEYRDPMEALIYSEKVNQLQTFIRSC